MDDSLEQTIVWAKTHFKAGTLIGDLARQPGVEDLTEDEENMLRCAYEGYLVGLGHGREGL